MASQRLPAMGHSLLTQSLRGFLECKQPTDRSQRKCAVVQSSKECACCFPGQPSFSAPRPRPMPDKAGCIMLLQTYFYFLEYYINRKCVPFPLPFCIIIVELVNVLHISSSLPRPPISSLLQKYRTFCLFTHLMIGRGYYKTIPQSL